METESSLGIEPHFTAFIDLLGFSEASTGGDDFTRAKVLSFLLSISSMRSEFYFKSEVAENNTSIWIKPTISTFSDHIVISYPLKRLAANLGDESHVALYVLNGFSNMLTSIAVAALSIGFLIRGGATVGNLYHSGGIVFGEAMVKAYSLESRTAIYPRVILSQDVCNQTDWINSGKTYLRRGSDGLYYFNFYRDVVLRSATPGEHYMVGIKAFSAHLNSLLAENLSKLATENRMAAFSKWAWFANELYSAMSELTVELRNAFGIDIEAIPRVVYSVPGRPQ